MANKGMIQVEAINIPAIARGFEALEAAAPTKVLAEGNTIARKIIETAKVNAPVKEGQYRGDLRPRFSVKKTSHTTEAEARADAPHSAFVEAGTGRRGRGTWKNQIENYVHGPKSGQAAHNTLQNAADEHSKEYRDNIIKLVNAGLR